MYNTPLSRAATHSSSPAGTKASSLQAEHSVPAPALTQGRESCSGHPGLSQTQKPGAGLERKTSLNPPRARTRLTCEGFQPLTGKKYYKVVGKDPQAKIPVVRSCLLAQGETVSQFLAACCSSSLAEGTSVPPCQGCLRPEPVPWCQVSTSVGLLNAWHKILWDLLWGALLWR